MVHTLVGALHKYVKFLTKKQQILFLDIQYQKTVQPYIFFHVSNKKVAS